MENVRLLCPACGVEAIGFRAIRNHLLIVHGIFGNAARPEGFQCHACGHRFPSYRAWRDHTANHHAYDHIEGQAGGNNGHGGAQNIVDDQEEMDVDMDEHVDAGDGNPDESGSETDEEMDEEYVALENLPNGRKDPHHAAVNMIVNMRSVAAMTRVGVSRAMSGAELVLKVNNISLREDVAAYLRQTGQARRPAAVALLQKFNQPSPFLGVKSPNGQISGIKKYFSFIQPETCYIGDRVDQRLGNDGAYGQVPVPNSYQYVSIKEILKLVARKRSIMEYVRNTQPSDDGIIYSYTDGDQYRQHPLFQQFPDAFQIVLYGDGVDPARSQGPKSGLHEIYNFLVEILNLPSWLRFSLGAIFPLIMANASDCRGTFHDVLHRFVSEIQELENGVRVFVNGQFITIRATLVAVKADSKAAHEMLGFLSGGARHFCRQCMISRPELHRGEIAVGVKRTPEMSQDQLEHVARNPAYTTQCGLRYRSCLNDSAYFRVENNNNFDMMHDGAEGLYIMVIRLCMQKFVCDDNIFTVEELNQRIFSFNYGRQNHKDKPTPNFSLESLQNAHHVYKQKMNAAQILVLLRALPFILDNIGNEGGVDEDDDHLQMLLLLLQIDELATVHGFPRDEIPLLSRLLENLRRTWYLLFPHVDPINRFHHFMHMPENILAMGPMRQYWCFREEGKNCPVKRHVSTCNNFTNSPMTAMEQMQIHVAKVWGTQVDIREERKFVKREYVALNTLPVARHLVALGFDEEYPMRICRAAYVRCFEYRAGEFLLYRKASLNADGLPRFGKILSILCPDDQIWFALQPWENAGLVERFNSYLVRKTENAPIHLIDLVDLPLHPPISMWRDYSTANSYLCLKFKVF